MGWGTVLCILPEDFKSMKTRSPDSWLSEPGLVAV